MNQRRPLLLDDRQPDAIELMEKTAGTRLSADSRMWQSEIVSQLAAAHPYLPAEDVVVEFNRLDPVKGAAVGTAKVGMTGVTIPLIIKRTRTGGDPELMPTDIFYLDGEYRPMTPNAVKSAMQSREIGEPLGGNQSSRMRGGNPYVGDLTGDASPLELTNQGTPFGGAGKTAGSMKGLPDSAKASILGGIAGSGIGGLRGLELAQRKADKDGKKLSLKDKMKALGIGAGKGGAMGAGVAAATHHAANSMGLEPPIERMKKKTASIREICEGTEFDLSEIEKVASSAGFIAQQLLEKNAVHPNDLANFRALIASNPQILQGASFGNLRVVEMILKHKGGDAELKNQKVVHPNVMILTKDPMSGSIRVKFSGGPAETIHRHDDIKRMLGDRYTAVMDSLRLHGVAAITHGLREVTWSVSRQNSSNAAPVERDGTYSLRDAAGGFVLARVAMQMMRFDGTQVPMRLAITDDGRYATAAELFGVRIGSDNKFKGAVPKKGDFGIFVSYTGGTPLPSTPVAIESIGKLTTPGSADGKDDDFIVFNVRDPIDGQIMALVPNRAVKGYVRIRDGLSDAKMSLTRGDIYLMPNDMHWVKLTGSVDVAKSADQVHKVAVATTGIRFGGGTFTITQGDKAWENLDDTHACELLAGMGVISSEHLGQIIKEARAAEMTLEPIELKGLTEPNLIGASYEEEQEETFPVMTTLLSGLRPTTSLMKSAAVAGEQALDVMLGLNFITPQNVRMFTDSIEQFDDVANKLASLLLASRLGLRHVPEDAVKEAMEGTARVSEHLRLLQSAAQFQRQQAQTTT